jgi:hypothetical protein
MKRLMLAVAVPRRKRGSTMSLPIPTMAELLKFAEKVKAERKATAEKLLTDRVMTREELIKHGLLSENDVN